MRCGASGLISRDKIGSAPYAKVNKIVAGVVYRVKEKGRAYQYNEVVRAPRQC